MEIKLSNADFRLLEIVWSNEPISSPYLCKLSADKLGWKRTTTYTVLKRLCEKKILQNEATIVSSLVSQTEFQNYESKQVLQTSFNGSLPQFIAAFLDGKKLSDTEAEQIKKIIDMHRR